MGESRYVPHPFSAGRLAMTKSELVQKLATANPHLYQRDVEAIVTAIFDDIAGALAAWLGGRHTRRELRRQRRRTAALERELAATQAQLAGAPGAAPASIAARG